MTCHTVPAGAGERLALLAAITLAINCGGGDSPFAPRDPERAVARVEITPPAVVLAEGREQTFSAQAYNAAGAVLPGRRITWSSSDNTVIVFAAPSATAVALREGTATIFAESEGVRGSATATITRAVVVSVEVQPVAVELVPGGEVDYVAVPRDDLGRHLLGRDATWESGDHDVATVTDAGRVIGRGFGATFIGATVEGVLGKGAVYLFPPTTNVTEIDLGTLGDVGSVARGINRHGVVVGYGSFSTGHQRAFRWTETGGMTDIGTSGIGSSYAMDINDSGDIVGYSLNLAGGTRALRWTASGGAQEISLGTQVVNSRATGINAAGDVAGVLGAFSTDRGFLRKASGEVDTILPPPGFSFTYATAVNAQRDVVGYAHSNYYYYYDPGLSRGFRWSSGTLEELGPESQAALDINDAGVIVGVTTASRPVRWTPGGPPTLLSTFGSESRGGANSINALGQIAGYAFGFDSHAVVWLPSGERVLLSGAPSEAVAISDAGWVVGWRAGPGALQPRATLWKIAGVSQP